MTETVDFVKIAAAVRIWAHGKDPPNLGRYSAVSLLPGSTTLTNGEPRSL